MFSRSFDRSGKEIVNWYTWIKNALASVPLCGDTRAIIVIILFIYSFVSLSPSQ